MASATCRHARLKATVPSAPTIALAIALATRSSTGSIGLVNGLDRTWTRYMTPPTKDEYMVAANMISRAMAQPGPRKL